MAYIGNVHQGKVFTAGDFLAHEECVRETREIPVSLATTVGETKYVKAGTFYPENSSGTVEGIVYEDVDVTVGAMPGSVVTKGVVDLSKLPAQPESGVQSALESKGFKFVTGVAPVRPEFPSTLTDLTVTSAEGAASGKTAITVSGVTLKTGEKYAYKITDSTAASVNAGEIVDDTWTKVDDFSDEIESTDDKKIAVVALTAAGEAYAYGNATVNAK